MIDYFTHSIVIDDIVFPDGRTRMGVLGGGGPQAAFGMRLWAPGGVGLCGSVGKDFPALAQAWLDAVGIDTAGVRRDPEHNSLRAWQLMEEDGRRTQVWRTPGAVLPRHLAFTADQIPQAYWAAKGFHLGVHPEKPNLHLVAALRARGICVSLEPFRAALSPLTDHEVRTLVTAGDLFSPNVDEAVSLVGPGNPDELVRRLAAAGARVVALRLAAEGALLYSAATGATWHVPALPTTVVDPVGAGNAYCGALLVGWVETGDLRRAGMYAAVAASFLVEQVGLPPLRGDLRAEANEDWNY